MKICGIIGGVGPSATADLFQRIVRLTPAKRDQDHIRVIIDNNPQIPDRSEAILQNGRSPVPLLLESALLLKKAGADFLACPCNTAHYFLPKVEKEAKISFINMIAEVGKEIEKQGIGKVGLLSTTGTAASKIYQKILSKKITVVLPSEAGMQKQMEAIYGLQGIKAGSVFEKNKRNLSLFLEVIEELQRQKVEAVIMGCTEIPLCLGQENTTLPLLNPTEILAKAIVREAL